MRCEQSVRNRRPRASIWKFHSRSRNSITSCCDAAIRIARYDFYTRILGLSEERRIAQIGLIQLRAGRSMIDLVPAAGPRVETGAQRRSRMHRSRGSRLERGRALPARAIGRSDRRAGDALWGAWRRVFRSTCAIPRATSSSSSRCHPRRECRASAPVAQRRLFSDKQDCHSPHWWPADGTWATCFWRKRH